MFFSLNNLQMIYCIQLIYNYLQKFLVGSLGNEYIDQWKLTEQKKPVHHVPFPIKVAEQPCLVKPGLEPTNAAKLA